jgi:predicted nucleic acid-binding protein
LLQPLFRRVQRGEASAFVSAITEAELLVRPERDGNREAVERITDLLSEDGFYVINTDRRIARRSAALRAHNGLRLPDAIIVATAIQTRCDAVVTNDAAWRKVNDLPLVILDELTTAR